MVNPKEKIKITPMGINGYPLRENIVGDAGKFVDDFIEARNSEMIYRVMGVNPDKSFLITGAPGNGKTMAIETLVNEINKEPFKKLIEDKNSVAEFKLLGFKYDTGKYGTAYINEGSKNVQAFFDTCFAVANQGYGALAVFDEADTLFGKRAERYGHKEDSKVLETIMKNMQKLHDTDNMYTVMMSNFPDAFDEASIRAGRVDKRYDFKNPTLDERVFAYTHAINQLNNKAGYKVIRRTNPERLAEISDNFSYSDIVESVNSAVKQKAKEVSSNDNKTIIDLNIWIGEKRVLDSIYKHKKTFISKPETRKIGFL